MSLSPRQSAVVSRATPWLFLLPALAVYGVFVLWPIADSFRLSLFHWRNPALPPEFCGLRNFRVLFADPVFWSALLHNVALLVLSLLTQLPLALALAILLSYPTRARGLFRTAFFAPMVMPSVAIAVLWGFVYLPERGILDQALRVLGRDAAHGWLSAPHTALACVFVTICWQYTGFYLVLFMAGLAAIPEPLYEAARLDGASEWQVCRRITLPLLRPVIGVAATLSIVGSLKYFDLVYMLAAGAPERSREVVATYIYRLAFASGQGRYGYGSAAAVVLLVLALSVAGTLHVLGRRHAVEPGPGAAGGT